MTRIERIKTDFIRQSEKDPRKSAQSASSAFYSTPTRGENYG
jgi:hypothetical protein